MPLKIGISSLKIGRALLNSAFLGDESIQLNKLLLPDLNLGLEDKDFQSILSYEGYQLK